MGLHDNEVHGALVFYSDLQNIQKIWLQILDRIQLLASNNKL